MDKVKEKIYLILTAVLLTAVIPAHLACAGEYVKGPVAVSVVPDSNSLNFDDSLGLEIAAVYPQDYSLNWPDIKDTNDFAVISLTTDTDTVDANHRIVSRRHYRLEPLSAGTIEIPSLFFIFNPSNDETSGNLEITTEPVFVKVVSTLPDDPNLVQKSLLSLAPVVPDGFSRVFWLISAAVIIIIITLLSFYWFKIRVKNNAPAEAVPLPYEIACQRLKRLLERDLIKNGQIKIFYIELTDILRKYIEARFDINAPDQTTEEFLAELAASDVLTDEHKNNLRGFLRQSDLVKFAKHTPEDSDINYSVKLAKDFIDTTKPEQELETQQRSQIQ